MNQQFTYGVVREGVIAETLLQISAKFPQTFRRISAPFPDAMKRISANFREVSAEFPQTFRKNPFANDPISELLNEHRLMIEWETETCNFGKWTLATCDPRSQKGGGSTKSKKCADDETKTSSCHTRHWKTVDCVRKSTGWNYYLECVIYWRKSEFKC